MNPGVMVDANCQSDKIYSHQRDEADVLAAGESLDWVN